MGLERNPRAKIKGFLPGGRGQGPETRSMGTDARCRGQFYFPRARTSSSCFCLWAQTDKSTASPTGQTFKYMHSRPPTPAPPCSCVFQSPPASWL